MKNMRNLKSMDKHVSPKPSFLRAVFAVVWKDILAEYRSLELVSAMSVFSLLVIIIFNFALDLQ